MHALNLPNPPLRAPVSLLRRALARVAVASLAALPLVAMAPAARAADAAGAPAASLPDEPTIAAFARAHGALVGVHSEATEGAPSAATLGAVRAGSGVVIGPDGLVLTIGYLLAEAERVELRTQAGRRIPARTVAYDVATGFGLLRPLLPLGDVPAAPLGSIADLSTGDALMVASNGAEADIDTAQVVSKRAFSGNWEYHIDAALFTAPMVRNHSGAAVFNQRGELVGIGSLLVMDVLGGAVPGKRLPGNMFVPVDLLRPVLAELLATGSSRAAYRPWLGLNSAESEGKVKVTKVSEASPAEAAGLQPGDVVLAVDGDAVTTLADFYKKLWSRNAPDAPVQLTIEQGGATKQLSLRGVDRASTLKKPQGV